MDATHASSRDVADLLPELATRWALMQAEFLRLYPHQPQPFLTQTYRSPADQNADYAKGRTVPGKVITNAKAGQSLHNYYPSLAFDVAFKDTNGNLAWTNDLFQRLGRIGVGYGLGWGGQWIGHFHDYPHFEPPKFTWEMAANHIEPKFPPIG